MSETGISNLVNQDESDDQFLDPEIVLEQVLADPNLLQHQTRTLDRGLTTVVGYFRIKFLPNQARYILHVPFSPTLNSIPDVQAHSVDDQNVRVRVTDIQKFGIRAEVILPRPAIEAQSTLIEILATEATSV